MDWTTCSSPLGTLTLVATADGALSNVYFADRVPALAPAQRRPRAVLPLLATAVHQLGEYFEGRRTSFELPLAIRGTPLQLAIWRRLATIPYGETVSYGEIAAELDPRLFGAALESHRRPRTVGAEVGRTPLPIVIPCHRVVGADGGLTGYGGGLHRKRALLELEAGVCSLPLG